MKAMMKLTGEMIQEDFKSEIGIGHKNWRRG
jgi:hypothetical protein